MKLLFILLLSVIASFPVFAQDGKNPSWTQTTTPTLEELVKRAGSMPVASAAAQPAVPKRAASIGPVETHAAPLLLLATPAPTTGGNAADEITPEISALARGLRYDPVLIYAFVRNHVDFVPYFGCKKGAHLTLMEMSGNDIDQSALLVALLRASGYAPSYRSAPVAFSATQHILWHGLSTQPYSYLSDSAFAAAIGSTATGTQLYNERIYYGLYTYLGAFGYPIVQKVTAGSTQLYGIPHVWVQVEVNHVTYQLSPSFKQYNWLTGIDLVAATGFSKSQLLTDANPGASSDTNGTTWVSDLQYAAISNRLSTYTHNFNNYIRANKDTIGSDEIFPHKQLIQKPILSLADADPFVIYTSDWATPATETWTKTAIPADRMSTLNVIAGTYDSSTSTFSTTLFNNTIDLSALKGRKLSLAFNGNTSTFRLDEATFGSAFTLPSTTTSVQFSLTHNNYTWTYLSGIWSKTYTTDNTNNKSYLNTYKKGNSYAYAFPYSFDDPQKLLRARQEILARYKRDGKRDDDWAVQTEVLNVMGLEWYSQTWRSRRVFAALDFGVSFFIHRFGRVAQEGSYYIDVFGDRSAAQHRAQNDIYSSDIVSGSALIDSAMEHGVIEQLQGSQAGAVSTVNAIYKANVDKTRIYRATSTNWAGISSQFTGYNNLPDIASAVTTGTVALLPKSGDIVQGAWTGQAYATETPGLVEMKISNQDGLNGGYSVVPGPAGTSTVVLWANTDPSYDSTSGNVLKVPYTPQTTPQQSSADPVDLFSGAFFIDQTDLSLSGQGPLGLDLSRHYNSHLRHENSSGLGWGWSDGNHVRIIERSSTRASLCETNSYQAAPFVVAALAQGGLHFQHTTAKEWATAALVAKWAIDQMKYNAAALCIGNTTLEFIRMPDGSFVPPPGVNMTLVKNANNSFTLTKRHGDTLAFDSDGRLTTITNTNGMGKNFTYIGDHLNTITDAFNRTLTYHWTGGSISSIGDGSRTISFNYDSGNLTSYTDPEAKTWTYHYDADHRMDWRKDPQSRMIIKNFYDSQNRIITQYSMGDATRIWQFSWSGFLNVEENPNHALTSYAYDDRGRSIVVGNALNEANSLAYDGQDRIYASTTPKNEVTYCVWNADNNLIGTIDPIEKTTSYLYDSSLDLRSSFDKRLKETNYTYTNHQINTVTDPLGHQTTYNYYLSGSFKGLLKEVIDAEQKKTKYEYDNWGTVKKITDQDQKTRQFTNNSQGDVITASDGENRTVTNTYNNRRQLLTSTLPTIPNEPASTITNLYDESGNLQQVTDAKSNVTQFTYNALGQNITTTLPVLSTGSNVITNTYDVRDWMQTTHDSLNHTVNTEYDAAHRVSAIIDPLMRRTEFTPDANGQTVMVKDALNHTTKQSWTARGEKLRATDALTKYSENIYDSNGNLTDYTDRRRKLYHSAYDDANRLQSSATPTLKTAEFTYYNNNLVKTIKEPSNQTTTNSYNGRNLVNFKTDPTGAVTYNYDDSGKLKTVTQNGIDISRTYDERGRLKTFTTADGDLIQYRYDANGNLRRIIYPPDTAHPTGRPVNYTYNARNLLETVTDWSGRLTTYQYDRLGRFTGIVHPNATTTEVLPDDANQLTWIKESANGKLFSYLHFDYDYNGQIHAKFRVPFVTSNWKQPTFTATYDDDNRLATLNGTAIRHDTDGNMTYGPISATSGNINLTYNARNQLTKAGATTYTYDAEGRRRQTISSSGTTRDVIDPSRKLLIRTRTTSATPAVTTKIYYVYGIGLLYEVDGAGHTITNHYDQVGSTIARTDDNGKVIGRAEYSPYGTLIWQEGKMDTPFLYNGQAGVVTDPNGLLNMRARYYSPYLMRFLNSDPSGFSGGSNWFAYADGNPISLSDPFGLCAESGVSFGQYMGEVGDVYMGYGDAAVGTVTGLYEALAHPIRTVEGVGNAVAHPVNTYNAIADSVSTMSNTNRGVGQMMGNIFIAAGTAGAGFAGEGAAAAGELGLLGAETGGEAFEIMDGVRRAKAASMAGHASIAAEIYDASGGTLLGKQDILLESLLSPNKGIIDVSNLTDIDRFASIHGATLKGTSLPPIKVTSGSGGVPVSKITFNFGR